MQLTTMEKNILNSDLEFLIRQLHIAKKHGSLKSLAQMIIELRPDDTTAIETEVLKLQNRQIG